MSLLNLLKTAIIKILNQNIKNGLLASFVTLLAKHVMVHLKSKTNVNMSISPSFDSRNLTFWQTPQDGTTFDN